MTKTNAISTVTEDSLARYACHGSANRRRSRVSDSVIIDYAHLPETERALPGDVSEYDAVIGYIHGDLNDITEAGIIEYTRGGGRFVAVHHMVSEDSFT